MLNHADYVKPGKDLQHLGKGRKKKRKYEKKGKNLCFWLLVRLELSPSLTPFLFTLACSPSFFLSPNFPLSHSHSLSRTSGGYLVWLCDSSLAMGQPALGLDVRLSASVGRRGKVVKRQTNVAFCRLLLLHVLWSAVMLYGA